MYNLTDVIWDLQLLEGDCDEFNEIDNIIYNLENIEAEYNAIENENMDLRKKFDDMNIEYVDAVRSLDDQMKLEYLLSKFSKLSTMKFEELTEKIDKIIEE